MKSNGYLGKSKYITFKGKKYALDFDRLSELCLNSSSKNGQRETEITEIYEPADNGEYVISQKVQREGRTNRNLQNDQIMYDIVKLLILTLLEKETPESMFEMDMGTALAINTLISWGALIEITE